MVVVRRLIAIHAASKFVDLSELKWSLCLENTAASASHLETNCIETVSTRSVHESLFIGGHIPNPLADDNDVKFRWIAESDWSFTTSIPTTTRNLYFPFIGGYYSEIFVDDKPIFVATHGSFVPVSIPLEPGVVVEGKLKILIKSAVVAAATKANELGNTEVPQCPPPVQNGFCGVEYLRIPQYGFGWDWGPGFGGPTGFELILNQVEEPLKIFVDTVFEDVDSKWELKVTLACKNIADLIGDQTVVSFELFEDNPTTSNPSVWKKDSVKITLAQYGQFVADPTTVDIEVKPWLPGSPNLYKLKICFMDDGRRRCFEKSEIGFRQVELQEIDGAKFLVFNKMDNSSLTRVEIRGTNMIPTNPFSAPPSDSEITKLFEEILASGMNMVRVWGGGFYGSDLLYSLANRNGIMIWEEFKFACASYPFWDNSFASTVEQEIQNQLTRIRSNPSLVVISGNNEVKQMLDWNWYGAPGDQIKRLRANYTEKMVRLVDDNVKKFYDDRNSQIVYISTSPQEGIDVHFYDYSGDCRDVEKYNRVGIISEYGFQSFCDWESCLSKMAKAENIGNEVATTSTFLAHRQHRQFGMMEIRGQFEKLLSDTTKSSTPVSVEAFVWFSQISQAVCLKAATESFRRNPKIGGVMYWQLNDVWPGASWSTIDYFNSRKPAWYTVVVSQSEKLVSLFVNADNELELVTAIGGDVHSLVVVDILNGEHQQWNVSTGNFKLSLKSACPKSACVAAVSPTNYILIGSPDRRAHEYDRNMVANPISWETLSDGTTTRLTAHVPTPFIFVWSDEKDNMDQNFFFLSPKVEGFEYVDLPIQKVSRVKTFWSHMGDGDSVSQATVGPHGLLTKG